MFLTGKQSKSTMQIVERMQALDLKQNLARPMTTLALAQSQTMALSTPS